MVPDMLISCVHDRDESRMTVTCPAAQLKGVAGKSVWGQGDEKLVTKI